MNESRALQLARLDPHQFTIQYPPSREYFQRSYRTRAGKMDVSELQRILIYVHIPFCEQKCGYCNFAVEAHSDAARHIRYVDALIKQIHRVHTLLPARTKVPGIDIGGGTPTMLSSSSLERLLLALRPFLSRTGNPMAVSTETTPRIASENPERLRVIVEGGVGRISMGLQSTNDDVLVSVGRGRQGSLGLRAAEAIRKAGFKRMNVDLIFALPGQAMADWKQDLDVAIRTGADSVTIYDCLYRGKGRPISRDPWHRPGPEDYGRMYDVAFEQLHAHGFHAPYGSVNFSQFGDETGTSLYFQGRLLDGLPYLGLGSSASSLVGDGWWFAPHRVGKWLDAIDHGGTLPQEDVYRLPIEERMAKYILLTLSFGILDPSRFLGVFREALEVRYGRALRHALDRGWIEYQGDLYRIRAGRFDQLPCIRALFYPPRAISWLEARRISRGKLSPSECCERTITRSTVRRVPQRR